MFNVETRRLAKNQTKRSWPAPCVETEAARPWFLPVPPVFLFSRGGFRLFLYFTIFSHLKTDFCPFGTVHCFHHFFQSAFSSYSRLFIRSLVFGDTDPLQYVELCLIFVKLNKPSEVVIEYFMKYSVVQYSNTFALCFFIVSCTLLLTSKLVPRPLLLENCIVYVLFVIFFTGAYLYFQKLYTPFHLHFYIVYLFSSQLLDFIATLSVLDTFTASVLPKI